MGGFETGRARDIMGVRAAAPFAESGRETALLVVEKFDLDQTRWAQRKLDLSPLVTVQRRQFEQVKVRPFEVRESAGNLMTEAGWAQLLKSFLVGSPTLFSATVGRIGIGTGSPTVSAADTALSSVTGMTGSNWILCGVAPTIVTSGAPSTAVFTASFGTAAAVGAWAEWAIDQGTASAGPTVTATAPMINHALTSVGTKGAATWAATATLSFT